MLYKNFGIFGAIFNRLQTYFQKKSKNLWKRYWYIRKRYYLKKRSLLLRADRELEMMVMARCPTLSIVATLAAISQFLRIWTSREYSAWSAGVVWKLKKVDWVDLSLSLRLFTDRIWLCVDQVISVALCRMRLHKAKNHSKGYLI